MLDFLLLALTILTSSTHDPALSAAAQVRAERHETRHDLSAYPQACGVGEVLAIDVHETAEAIVLWLDSPWHAFVIAQSWDRVGLGYHDGFLVATFAADCT